MRARAQVITGAARAECVSIEPEMSISSTLVDRAEIEFHEAADAIRPFVGCFWVMTAQRDATIRLVADGSTAISIQLQKGHTAEWFLRGPLVRPDERRFTSDAQLVGIRLRPGVAFLLNKTPAHTIVGRRIGLNGVAAFRDLVAECRARAPDARTMHRRPATVSRTAARRCEPSPRRGRRPS